MHPKADTLRCGIPSHKAPREEACPGNFGNSWKSRYKRRGRSSACWAQLGPTLPPYIGDQRPRNRKAESIENQQQNRRMCGKRCDNTIEDTLDR
jgi:hypothetical protein